MVGDHVLLKVSPTKSTMGFERNRKLNPQFVGPFEILERVGTLAYKVALPPRLFKIHNVFHVLALRKYVFFIPLAHVVELEPIQMSKDLTDEELPVLIVDVTDKVLGYAIAKLVEVQWNNYSIREATWELDEEMREASTFFSRFKYVKFRGLNPTWVNEKF